MIIDAHAHAAGPYVNAEAILATSARYGLDKVALCTSPKNNLGLQQPPNFPFMKSPHSIFILNRLMRMGYRSFKDQGDGNAYVANLRNELPEIIVPFLWVNPLDPGHMSGLETKIRESSWKGIKLHQAWNAFQIDGREFSELVGVAAAHHLPIFIHLYSQKETQKLCRFAVTNPKIVFIIAHMMGLDVFQESRTAIPNVYFDTSGSERVREQDIQEAIKQFGVEHVVFGTDAPYAGIDEQIQKIDHLNLPGDAKDKIFRLNFETILSGSAN